jgi:MFS family permease
VVRRTAWVDVAVLVGAGIVAAFQVGKVPPSIPLLHAQLGVDGVAAGWVLSIFSAIGAAGGIAFGQLADRVGRRHTALIGLMAIAVAGGFGAFSENVGTLLVTRVVEGFGFMSVAVAVPALIAAAATEADRRIALGFWASYLPVGSAIVLLASPLILGAGGWRLLWTVTSLAAALAGCVLALRIPPEVTVRLPKNAPKVPRAPFVSDVRAVLAARYPLIAGTAFGAYAASYFILVGFLPTILVAAGRAIGSAAVLTAVVVLANGCGNVCGGVASRRFPRALIILAGALALGAGAALVYVPGIPLVPQLIAATLASFVGGLIPGAVTAAVPQLAPEPRLIATTQGLVVQCAAIGQLTGPVVVAALGAAHGGTAGSAVLLILAALGAAMALLLRGEPSARC